MLYSKTSIPEVSSSAEALILGSVMYQSFAPTVPVEFTVTSGAAVSNQMDLEEETEQAADDTPTETNLLRA